MKEQTYESFLIDKINDEHTLTHLLQQEVASQRKRITELLKDMSNLRRSQNDMKLRNKQIEQKLVELQMQNRKLKDTKYQKVREGAQIRKKQQKSSEMDSKQIFKMYIDNTFPKYKGMIKKILKFVYIIEDTNKQQPQKKIKIYRSIFQNGVKRVLDWLFPKKNLLDNKKQLAENIVSQWKKQEQGQKNSLNIINKTILKEAAYIKQIEELEAKVLMMKSSLAMMQGRLKTYQRSISAKGSQFVAHLKKLLQISPELEEQAKQKVQQTLHLFTTVINLSKQKTESRQQQKNVLNYIPLVLSQTKTQLVGRKKAAPILKKNIFGYYHQPQFAGNYTVPSSTKHSNNNKATQTLPEDLCILTLHPVIMVTLIDGSIKPQRNRHNQQHYVSIKINQEKYVESAVKQSLQPAWNQPFLLKDYDFPFIHVQLIHKSKGLKDYSLGGGKFSASSQEQKIVNVRKDKEFMGRVRFSLSYPKGSIFQFKITSVTLQFIQPNNSIKQQIGLKFPYNGQINLQFTMPEKIIYTDKSVIILQNSQEKLKVSIVKQDLHQFVTLKEFTQEGSKQVIVFIDNSYKVIIQGQIYLLVCEDQQPQRISEQLIEGGKGKFFSVRAPPPIITVTYNQTTLHSNIKFPLVFFLLEQFNSLSIVKEMNNRQLRQEKVDQIVNQNGFLKLSEFIKAPTKIYKIFIQTLQGQEVVLKHQNNLFERLLKQIHLQVSYKEEEVQQVNYNRKKRNNKEVLFKQFTIQSKELMLNHYKVFTRHFKRIGFVKFKLGYTVYNNELTIQTEQKQVKKQQILPQLKQGLYFIELQVTSAHFNSRSTSEYSVKINQTTQTKKMKGKHPKWKQSYTFSFQLKEKLEFEIIYQVIEYGTFGQKSIYQGMILIDERIISLGAHLIRLDQKGQDCLHFGKITLPTQLYHIGIHLIEAEIEEEADWIGKIDPYLILCSKNSQLFKTNYLDNIGSNPVWQNISKHIFVTKQEKDKEQIFSCKIYDYDLIGKDDYVGEVIFTSKVNTELVNGQKSKVLYGSIVKQNRTCGSMKIKGLFEKIKQPQLKFNKNEMSKLTGKDLVYKLVLYEIQFINRKEMEGDQIKMSMSVNEEKKSYYNFRITQNKHQFSFIKFGYKCQELFFDIQRQYKSFFKNHSQTLGKFSIKITDKQFKITQSQILNEMGQVSGYCRWFLECLNKAKYAIITDYMSCKKQTSLFSDVGDRLQLSSNKNIQIKEPLILVYQNGYKLQMTNNQKNFALKEQKMSSDVIAFVSEQQNHQDIVFYIKIQKELLFETKLEERSIFNKIVHDRNFKQIKYLHWEPYAFRQKNDFKMIACFTEISQDLIFNPGSSTIYNQFILLNRMQNSIIFQSKNMPRSIKLIDNLTKEQLELSLIGDISRIFVPKKGALYCQIEDYNHKSILQLNFKYIFIRFKQENFQSQSLILELTAVNNQKVTVAPILNQNCFLIRSLHLFIKEPSASNAIFFQAELKAKQNNKKCFQKMKFGLRLQQNKSQYRFVQSNDAVVHTEFDSCLVERKYEQNKPVDNTIYGMSFIKLKKIEFQMNADVSDKQVYLELLLINQREKIILEKNKGSNVYLKQSQSIFYIQKYALCELTLVEVGILSNKIIGKASCQISQALIRNKQVHLKEQVKQSNQIIGKIQIVYENIEDIEFIDLNFFSFLSQYQDMAMTAELQQFGPGKQKYQSLSLTSKTDIQRLESQDSFIVVGDLRNYQINVYKTNSKKMLGQFKLVYDHKNAIVLQPLRTNSQSLNGVLIIEYQNKRSNKITFQMNKDKEIGLIKLNVLNINYKDEKSNEDLCLRLKTSARCITHLPKKKPSIKDRQIFQFLLYDNQNTEFFLINQRFQILGIATITGPYNNEQERVMIFYKNRITTAICSVRCQYVSDEAQFNKMREISSIEATDLLDTEYFVKMKPFLQIEDQKQKMFKYVSDLGLGRQKIYWKLNIISSKMLNFTIKDKDMFFDDLIGSAILPQNISLQKEELTTQINLFSAEEQNRKGGNGKIKITTVPVYSNLNKSKKQQNKQIEVKCFMLRLGGIKRHEKIMQILDEIEVELQSGAKRFVVFTGKYNKDLLFYLQNKDLQISFDTISLETKKTIILINFKSNNKILHYQALSLGESKQRQSENTFQICQVIPLKMRSSAIRKIYFWLYQKFKEETDVLFVSDESIIKGNILLKEKRLLIVQPMQLCKKNKGLSLHVLQSQKQFFKFKIDDFYYKSNQSHFYGVIQNQKQINIGKYYIQTACFYSQGEEQFRTVYIGKSRKKWLCITIVEAFLTKDLQLFSKMDPYCKVALLGRTQAQQIWHKTSVKDNIGLHPIWNDTFMLQLKEKQKVQKVKILVMDSEVTIDRKIGEGTSLITDLVKTSQQKEIQLFYMEKEKSGKLIVKSIVVSRYIVIRNVHTFSDEPLEIYLSNIENKGEDRIKITEGQNYPIDQRSAIVFFCQDKELKYTFNQLKARQSCKIIFTQKLISLHYELYE